MIPFRDAVRVWARVAALSFGGPAGQIAVMHRILVEEKRWISEDRFLHALNYCMLLPGPEATQLATYVGWLLHGARGGLVAGWLFVLPGFVALLALSIVYAEYQAVPAVAAVFFGLKPAVLAVVVEALVRIGKRALRDRLSVALAAAAFLALFLFQVPFPLVIAGAAALGLAFGRARPRLRTPADLDDGLAPPVRPTLGRAVRVAAIWLTLWFAPLGALALALGPSSVFVQEGLFFSQMAVVTFGGAYAVLSYVAQQAVERFGWLAPGEMVDGLGMAETTPGPLIMVVQFVGFLAAYRNPGPFPPLVAGVLGSIVTTWTTFVPCFLWIFLGAPYVEAVRGRPRLDAALAAITAAVTGVILNLAVWFALHVLFARVDDVDAGPLRLLVPDPASLDPLAAILAAAAFLALFRLRIGMLWTLAACVAIGAALELLVRS